MTTSISICVFCGASTKVDVIYQDEALQLGESLAKKGLNLVFGGGKLGLMGMTADSVLRNGGKAYGFIPNFLDDIEGAHKGLTELHIVDSMHTRKCNMEKMADAFIILPGGFGTLDEFFEIVTWRQIGLHNKPIIVINTNNYWGALKALMKQVVCEKFARPEHLELVTFVNSSQEAITHIEELILKGLLPNKKECVKC